MLDLSDFDVDEKKIDGVAMTLENPVTNEPFVDKDSGEPLTITLVGQDSAEFKRKQHEINRRMVAAQAGRGRPKVDLEAMEENSLDLLVACTKGWSHIGLDGKELECVPANVRAVYQRFKWIREQVDAFVGNRAHFLKA